MENVGVYFLFNAEFSC